MLQMMYHHNHLQQQQQQHRGKSVHSSTKMPLIPERHFIVQGATVHGDSGLVLSTDAKPRLKWTHELHERFIEAVCQLGGAEKATPKTVMKVMGIPGLTLYHLKSHLQIVSQVYSHSIIPGHQKYRLSKNVPGQTNSESNKFGAVAVAENRLTEANGSQTNNFSTGSQTNNCSGVGNSRSLDISEALQMQIEVQRRLHEQLEVQRHLQLRIEAQGKYLQSVLEKAQETLGRQNIGAVGLETAKVQLSELVSKVSMQCLAGEFPELQRLCPQSVQPPDGSFESCLTCCEGSLKDPELHNGSLGNVCGGRLDTKDNAEGWSEVLKETVFFSSMGKVSEKSNRRSGGESSMNMGRYIEEKEGSSDVTREGGRVRRREESLWKREESVKSKQGEKKMGWSTALDLNAGEDENGSCSESKQLDLNGFSWE